MKIALFVHCFFPDHFFGTETYTLDLAKNLLALGHEPTVVTAVFPGETRLPSPVHAYDYEGVPVIAIDKNLHPNTRIKDTYYQEEIRPVLTDVVRRLKPDIAHVTHLINHTGVLLEVLRDERIPTVGTFTDFFGFCYNNRLEDAFSRLCNGPNALATNCLACHVKAVSQQSPKPSRRVFFESGWGATASAHALSWLTRLPGQTLGPRAGLVQDLRQRPKTLGALYANYQRVIAPSVFLRNAYARNGLANNMTSIRFGVDIDRRAKPSRATNATLRIGFIGQIAPHKGTDLLIDAARIALDGADYELLIYGGLEQDPGYTRRLQAAAQGLPVRFMGTFPKERMREVLDSIDVLAMPSRWYENSPLVLLNALATGTPTIVSDVEGMTEFVKDGENGFVFRRGDVDDLARVLTRIRERPQAIAEMASRTSYPTTTRSMTEQTLAIYKTLVQSALNDENALMP